MAAHRPIRVLLVRPPGRFTSLRFPDGPMVGPPRALLYLAEGLDGLPGVEVRVLDALAEVDADALQRAPLPVLFGLGPDQVAARAADWKADVVGLTTMANYYRRETVELVHALRHALPEAFLLLGGPDPTVEAERYLADCPADAVCLGEGEQTLAELVTRLQQGQPWTDVPGLAWSEADGLRHSPPRTALTDLDAGVPDLRWVDIDRYADLAARGWRSRPTFLRPGVERTADLVTTRGCPYRCRFCVIHATMGRRFRTRSIPSVIDQLRRMVEVHGVQHVHFEDDVINLDRRRFAALLQALVDADLPLTWDTPNGVRADLLDADTIALCRASGCVYLIFGVESGNQRVLDQVVDKELDLADVVEAARLCHEAELDTLAFYIVGMPGETRPEIDETVRFAFDLFDRYGTTPLLQVWRPYVQTELHDRAARAGRLVPADPTALHDRSGIPFTQFRDRALDHPSLGLDELSAIFADYSTRLAAGQLARWRRAGQSALAGAPGTGDDRDRVERFLMLEAPFLHAARRAAQVS